MICANAYRLVEHEGIDLYGLDLSIELVRRLIEHGVSGVSLIFAVSCNAADNLLYGKAKRLIETLQLDGHFCLYDGPVDFAALMTQCDIVLRPTSSDGDALTVREALYFGIPVIASDAVERPEGTITFENRDIDCLLERTLNVLRNEIKPAPKVRPCDYDEYFEKYPRMYEEILSS
ncbi:MAG: glycosyltransferase [Phycisphaerales bacterium]|nr:MAG: glycosyltransferase [Phycisphaerales bacterium]